jgi:cytochrome b561
MSETERYTAPAIAFHWIIFLLVGGGWALGSYMSGLPFSPQKLRYVSWHKWTGVTIFLLAGLRLMWRLGHPAPLLPAMPQWQRRLAALAHVLLYALILVIPLTGWLFSSAAGVPTVYFGIVQLPDLLQKNKATADLLRLVHTTLNWTLLGVVIGHTFFALKHHFVDRDTVLARMLPLVRPRLRKHS